MKDLPMRSEGPAASLERVEKMMRGMIIDIENMIREDRLDYKDLQRILLTNCAIELASGGDPGVTRRLNCVRQHVDSIAKLMEKESQELFQQSLSNRIQAIEIELEKDYRRKN